MRHAVQRRRGPESVPLLPWSSAAARSPPSARIPAARTASARSPTTPWSSSSPPPRHHRRRRSDQRPLPSLAARLDAPPGAPLPRRRRSPPRPRRSHRPPSGAPLPSREVRECRPRVRGGLALGRLTGRLVFHNKGVGRGSDDGGVEEAAFELPCLENATSVSLDLGFLVLALPPAGTFTRLTELVLIKAWFHGPSALGDLVSSHRCPSLQKRIVRDAIGLLNLAIHSESLLQVELRRLIGLQQLIMNAPVLKELKLPNNRFAQNQHTADLSAPQLVSLELSDPYVPSSIKLGNMPLLQGLTTSFFLVYGPEGFPSNHTILELLTRFRGIQDLTLNLTFPKVIGNDQYLMEDITMIPRISFLTLVVMNYGHAFGGSLFHVLKNCIGLRSLSLHFEGIQEEQFACPSGCICDQPINWKTDKLLLNCLQEVEITNMNGADREVAFLEQLFNWATALKNMRVVFHCSVSESRARELRHELSSFFGPETCTKFYICGDDPKLLSLLP